MRLERYSSTALELKSFIVWGPCQLRDFNDANSNDELFAVLMRFRNPFQVR